jgi:hypothetical protein
MTGDTNMSDPEKLREKMLAQLTEPMPDDVKKGLAAATAIDNLAVTIEVMRMAVDLAQNAHDTLGLNFKPVLMERRWLAANQLLRDTFGPLEASARATITAVNAMLDIE